MFKNKPSLKNTLQNVALYCRLAKELENSNDRLPAVSVGRLRREHRPATAPASAVVFETGNRDVILAISVILKKRVFQQCVLAMFEQQTQRAGLKPQLVTALTGQQPCSRRRCPKVKQPEARDLLRD